MLVIPNTTLLDDYDETTTWGGQSPLQGGSFVVANNPATVQLRIGEQGVGYLSDEMYLPPGVYPVGGGTGDRKLLGLRAKNFLAGSDAQFFGSFPYPGEASVAASSSFDSIIAASGAVENLLGLITRKSITATQNCVGTEVAPTMVVETDDVLYSGTGLIVVRFTAFCQAVAGTWSLSLWRDSSNIGRVVPPTGGSYHVSVEFFDTPTAANHKYSIRGWLPAGGNFNVLAGLGAGAGTQLPADLTVWST